MKAISNIYSIVILMILSLTFSAWEKDAISVKSEKVYRENLPALPGGWGSLSMSLTLRPNGTATLVEEGIWRQRANIKSKGIN